MRICLNSSEDCLSARPAIVHIPVSLSIFVLSCELFLSSRSVILSTENVLHSAADPLTMCWKWVFFFLFVFFLGSFSGSVVDGMSPVWRFMLCVHESCLLLVAPHGLHLLGSVRFCRLWHHRGLIANGVGGVAWQLLNLIIEPVCVVRLTGTARESVRVPGSFAYRRRRRQTCSTEATHTAD